MPLGSSEDVVVDARNSAIVVRGVARIVSTLNDPPEVAEEPAATGGVVEMPPPIVDVEQQGSAGREQTCRRIEDRPSMHVSRDHSERPEHQQGEVERWSGDGFKLTEIGPEQGEASVRRCVRSGSSDREGGLGEVHAHDTPAAVDERSRQAPRPTAEVDAALGAPGRQGFGNFEDEALVDRQKRFAGEEAGVVNGDLFVVNVLPKRARDSGGKLPVGAVERIGTRCGHGKRIVVSTV